MAKREIMVANIRANMARIDELLDVPNVLNKMNDGPWWSVNRNNSELRQRMHMLRRDTKALEKIMLGGKSNE